MKMFFSLLFLFLAAALPGEVWKAPGPEEVPQSKVYPPVVSAARWLWFQAPEIKGNTNAFYRYTVVIPEEVKQASAFVLMDDAGTMLVNGKAPRMSYPPQPKHLQLKTPRFDFGRLLKPGKNVLTFAVHNNLLTGGLFLRGEIILRSGKKIPLLSTKALKAAPAAPANWQDPAFDDSSWPEAWEFGDAMTSPWNTASNILDFGLSDKEKQLIRNCLAKATELPAKIASEQPRRTKIDFSRQAPGLVIDGTPIPPMLHIVGDPFAPGNGDMTVKLASAGVRWCEVALLDYNAVRENGYDFSQVDSFIRRTLALAPETFIGLSIRFSHRNYTWMARNPEELVVYPTGKADQNNDTFRRRAPSMASEKYRAEMRRFLTAFFEHARKQPWYARVISCRVSNGCFLEWHYYGMRRDMPDIGKAMTAAFRKFLVNRYKTDEALRKAWHDEKVTLRTASVPGVADRKGKGNFLRDPSSGTDRKVMDYYECHQHVVADTLLDLAAAVKKCAPHLLVGAYYGYAVQMNFPPEGQTILLDKVLSSPCIDFLSAPICYDSARAPSGDGLKRTLPSVFARYGKLHIVEQDTRTHITYPKHYTAAQSAELFLRDTASAWLDGCGTQLLSLHGMGRHWMNAPEILSAIRQGIGLWEKLYARPARERIPGRTAVVLNTPEMFLHGFPVVEQQSAPVTALTTNSIHALHRSGHTFDLLDLKGFLANGKKYKTAIFLNLFTVDSETRAKLLPLLRAPGMTAIFICAPGLVTEKGWSEKAASELTGINLKLIPGGPLALKNIPLTPAVSLSPRMAAVDPAAQKLAGYKDDDSVCGMAKKTLPGGAAAIFSAAPVTDPALWDKLLTAAGSESHTAPGQVTLGFGGRLLIPVWKKTTLPVFLPAKIRKVRELYSGRTLRVDEGKLTLKSSGPTVWLLEF